MNKKSNFNLYCIILLMVSLLAIGMLGQCTARREGKKLKTKISGTIEGEYYVSPGRLFKMKIPVSGSLGGTVEDKGNEKEQIFVLFMDDFMYVYLILSIPTDKSCEYNLAKARTKLDFQGEETVTTPRGSEIWTRHLLKGGSPKSYREMQKDGKWGKPKRDDMYVTRTCFRVGNRVYIFSVGCINTQGTIQYNNKERLFEASKKQLKKFLEGFNTL
jgi:hypothetical protein